MLGRRSAQAVLSFTMKGVVMKIVLTGAVSVFLAASAAAVDITAIVREANAATVTYVSGSPYNSDNPNGTGKNNRQELWIRKPL